MIESLYHRYTAFLFLINNVREWKGKETVDERGTDCTRISRDDVFTRDIYIHVGHHTVDIEGGADSPSPSFIDSSARAASLKSI